MVGAGGQGTVDRRVELEALLSLRLTPGIGDRISGRLLKVFPSATQALEASADEYRQATGRARPDALGSREIREQSRSVLDRAQGEGMAVLGRTLPGYPLSLEQLADPPPILFTRGDRRLLHGPNAAVIGTRRATAVGRRFTRWLAQVLAREGVPVVSGLALGIDAQAHRGALEHGGTTVAVLGTGLDRTSPPSHRRLQQAIGERDGLLVTEFLPGEGAQPHHFPRRNRILAALSTAIVVVEAGERSGALITVDHGLDLGREIFAVPGPLNYSQSAGTNGLLRDGAWPLTHPEELIQDWRERGILSDRAEGASGKVGSTPSHAADSSIGDSCSIPPTEGRPVPMAQPAGHDPLGLLPILGLEPQPADRVARRIHRPIHMVLRALSELELAGVVIREPEGWRRPPSRTPPADRLFRRSGFRKRQHWWDEAGDLVAKQEGDHP